MKKVSPRIVTLTLHPAIDRIVRVAAMTPGATFDGRIEASVPAGKGVNTARVLRMLCGPGQRIVAAVWVGWNEEIFFDVKLRNLADVTCDACARPVATRFAQTYLADDGTETHVKEAMPPPSAIESKLFLDFWGRTVKNWDIVAICGSAPPKTKAGFLKEVFQSAKENGASAIVADTNGAAMRVAAKAGISLLKGNAMEFGELLECTGAFDSNNSAHRRILFNFLKQRGAPKSAFITLGAKGAVLAGLDGGARLLHARINPNHRPHKTVSTTGCGDAATASILWSLLNCKDVDSASKVLTVDDDEFSGLLKHAVAVGAAKTLSPDPGAILLKSVQRFVRYCVTTSIDMP